jgi:dihydroorotase
MNDRNPGSMHAGAAAAEQATPSPSSLVIRRPDDWHVHLRDGDTLRLVADYTARQFARAIIMPNLSPPVTTIAAARSYRERILAAVAPNRRFTPLMTAYLTDEISADEIAGGFEEGVFAACKLYPANVTTNSAAGVTDVARIHGVLERMQRVGMPLLVHGEVVDSDVDIFDREAVFIDRVLSPMMRDFPDLKIVLEHITTEQAVQFVSDAGPNLAATITAHHLEINRNAMLVGGIRPHLFCLPVVKRERHRLSLRRAAVSGNPKFFLGTDTAPHAIETKETACGCAGIFSAPVALESYVRTFAEEGALDRFQAFASESGPRFYELPLNEERVRLVRREQQVPAVVESGSLRVVPFHAGESMQWTLEEQAPES